MWSGKMGSTPNMGHFFSFDRWIMTYSVDERGGFSEKILQDTAVFSDWELLIAADSESGGGGDLLFRKPSSIPKIIHNSLHF